MRFVSLPRGMLVAVLVSRAHALGASSADPSYVLLTDKPAEAVILAGDLTVIHRFTIAAGFTEAAVGPPADRLYLLYNGLFGPDGRVLRQQGRLRVYELASGRLLAEHQLGWDSRGLLFSPDRRYLALVSRGWQYAEGQTDPDGLLVVIDTSSLQAVARSSIGRLLGQALFMPHGSGLITLTGGRIYRRQPKRPSDYDLMSPCVAASPIKERRTVQAAVSILVPPDFRASGTLKLSDAPSGMALVGGGETLVLVDPGMAHWRTKNQEIGSVQVVSLSGLQLLERGAPGVASLIVDPASDPGAFYVLSATRFNSCRLQLSRWSGNRLLNDPGFGIQDGWPHSALPVSGGKRLIVSLMRDCDHTAGLRNQVAIVNLSTGKIEREVAIGRKGIRAAKLFGELALLVAFPLPTMLVNVARGFPQEVTPPERIWVDERQTLAFVLDTDSDDVTALEIDSGKILGRVAVGAGPLGLFGATGGPLLAVSRDQLTWMATAPGRMEGRCNMPEGEPVLAAFGDAKARRVVLLTGKGVLTWHRDRPGPPQRANDVRGARLLLKM